MNKANMDLQKSKRESQNIYRTLCNSHSMYRKCLAVEIQNILVSLLNTLSVVLNDDSWITIITGSASEGSRITSFDYGKDVHSTTPCYISDADIMQVWCHVRVIDEGDTLPERFDNYMYCRAERGEHTTEGFRKLRVIHSEDNLLSQYREYKASEKKYAVYNMPIENGYISSSKFLATTVSLTSDTSFHMRPVKAGIATKGPSQILDRTDGPGSDFVRCFNVKTWPKEAESWFTRQTIWPDMKLKNQIKKIGYLLVPTGNNNSPESDLEWRCSFSIAEKILFQSMTKFQRCTFLMLKVLLKEYLPSDINTDGEKQLLSTYHMKTVFLWSLEDSKLVWEPGNMIDIIGHMLDLLMQLIHQLYLPHYFIPTINLFNERQLHGRESPLIHVISFIRNDLLNKIKQSHLFVGKEIILIDSEVVLSNHRRWGYYTYFHYHVMRHIIGQLHKIIHDSVFSELSTLKEFNFSHLWLIESLMNIKHVIEPQGQHLYRAMFTGPVHAKLLNETVPGLIDQYRGCIHLAKYCISARDGRVLPGVLHTAESLLKDTLHLDPCSGYVKLVCLCIVTGDFVQAMDILDLAENNFLYIHKRMKMSVMRGSQGQGIEVNTISTEVSTVIFNEIFQKWADGKVTSDIVVAWPEYTTVPGLLQFELIHDSTQQITDVPYIHEHEPGKMVGLDCTLQWPPLSMIKLLKFVCAFNSGGCFTLQNLVAELIASSLYIYVYPGLNDIYTVFNMAAWCYIKIKKYKPATRMVTLAIGTSLQTEVMKICAFSHHFLAYVIEQCLAKGRVLVYKRDTLAR